MNELFTIPESQPPRIVTLRKAYDDAVKALDVAKAKYNPILDDELLDNFYCRMESAQYRLSQEEARLASEGKH